MASGVVVRIARARTNAPSSAQSMAIVSSRAVSSGSPASSSTAAPAAIQCSNTSAQAHRSTSLVLEVSSATVAIGHASA